MVRCATCGQPLSHIDEACAVCLPGFYERHAPTLELKPAPKTDEWYRLEWEQYQ